MNYQIIGFCGRLQSGKSTIANVCEEFGYKRIYFAQPLKELCGNLLNVNIEKLNKLKVENTPINFILNKDICEKISQQTLIPIEVIEGICLDKQVDTVRDLLQFVGTDIIRKYNKDWHVNKIREMLKPNQKYVIDDVRFQNEKELLEELGATLWFVVRPSLSNVSNHISETSVKWQDINNIIVNDKSLSYLETYWRMFMENGYEASYTKRQEVINSILGHLDRLNELQSKKDFTFSLLDALFISIYEFTYKPITFDDNTFPSVELNCDGNYLNFLNVLIDDNNGVKHFKAIKNPLNVEDYKFKMFD